MRFNNISHFRTVSDLSPFYNKTVFVIHRYFQRILGKLEQIKIAPKFFFFLMKILESHDFLLSLKLSIFTSDSKSMYLM